MLTQEEKKQFGEILETLGETLDITETQYNTAVSSYGAVGEWLAKPESSLAPYKPVVRPQGSFMLGTMIKPICEDDDLDIDLVCELTGKNPRWTQYHLKQVVGNRLKANETYKNMLDGEGRRCWTLMYSDSANYHMDILPSLVCSGYNIVLEKAFSDTVLEKDYESLAIRITDNKQNNYYTDTIAENWMKSNPFGYGRWFFNAANVFSLRKSIMLAEAVSPVPKYNKEKLPLQRVVQILKRHRDIMFNGDEDKPISIIITTLASRAYNKETSIIDALTNVITNMRNYIENRYDSSVGRTIKWIPNPVQGCVYIVQHTVYAAGFRSTSGSLAHFAVPNRGQHVQLGIKTARHAVHCDTGEKGVRTVGFLLVFLCVKANVECRFHNSLFKLQNYCNSLKMSSMQASQIATGLRQFRTICTPFPFLFVGGTS